METGGISRQRDQVRRDARCRKLGAGQSGKARDSALLSLDTSLEPPRFRYPATQRVGQDLSTLVGGNYINRFSIQGRGYKVIPQVARVERLTADQLSQIYVTGSQDKLVPLSTFASLRTTAEPRELKKFQQLNAVRIQGVIPPPVPLDQALRFLENEANASLPQGFTIDYAGQSRQLRTGAAGSRYAAAIGDPDLSGSRGPVRELPGSVHHPRGLGAAGALGSPAVLVSGTDDAQHLQSGRTDHAGRIGVEERHPHRAVRHITSRRPAGTSSARLLTRQARGCVRF